MMYIYDKKTKRFLAIEETDFKSHEILERRDLEKLVIDFPEILGEELLIITTEYDKFDKTKERLDLLCIDKNGKMVIVELKRDESRKSVELQAIKYAAYCSTLAMEDIIALRKDFLAKNGKEQSYEETKEELLNFIDDPDFENLDDKPRIILVAKEFRPEVTATVLWLRKFGIDISCVKLTLYKIDDDKIGLVSSIIIPLPEAEEYIIKSERKESIEKAMTRTQEEYLNFFKALKQGMEDIIPNLHEPYPRRYYSIPTGISNVHFEWVFWGRPRSSFCVELHFEKRDKEANRNLLKEVKKLKNEIEREAGEKVLIQEDWGKFGSRLYIEKKEGRITEELKKWAIEKMRIFYKLIQPKLEKLR